MDNSQTAQFEVEQKYAVADPQHLLSNLASMGVQLEPAVEQIDRYFNHPQRCFGTTDEALRIRSVGETNRITYKGPKLGTEAKTRREIELSVQSGDRSAIQLAEMLEILSFRPVLQVAKQRRRGTLEFEDQTVEVSIDHVESIGVFVELELVTDEAGIDSAQKLLKRLSERLELVEPQTKSYLEMLLERQPLAPRTEVEGGQ